MFVFTETTGPIENLDVEWDPILYCSVKAVPQKWTTWMTLDVTGPLTLKGMMDKVTELYSLKVSMIILGAKTCWMSGTKSHVERYLLLNYIKVQ